MKNAAAWTFFSDMAVRALNYGKGTASLEGAEQTLPAFAIEELQDIFGSPSYEPPILPAAAIELLELTRKPNVGFADVRRVMERDPFIAAKVLRTAQSAAYSNAPSTIQTLDDALVRLGLETLSLLFLEITMRLKVFRVPGFEEPMRQLARHSAATAHAARHIARRTALYDEHIFLCGLLHDVGISASLVALTQVASKRAIPSFEALWPLVSEIHALASETVCRAWRLPPDVILAVGRHHRPMMGAHVHPVAALLSIADWIVGHHGYGIGDEALEAPSAVVLATVGVSGDKALAALVQDCKGVLARVDA